MEYLWGMMVKALVVQVTAGGGKYVRLSASFGVFLGSPADFVLGITQVWSNITFQKRSVSLPPLFSEVRGGRITEAANTLRAVRIQAGLEMSVLMPLVSGFCCGSCQSSQKWQGKENYFTHGRGPAEQSSLFSCFWWRRVCQENEGRQKWRHRTLRYAVIWARACSIKSLISTAQVKKPA